MMRLAGPERGVQVRGGAERHVQAAGGARPALVLAAHGTRDPAGAATIEELAAAVRVRHPEVPVHVAYADVRGPSVTDVLSALPASQPAVVVPAFLASGYHVRVDVPEQVAASGHPDAVLAPAFGPAPELVGALVDRLVAAGYRPADRVVLAAAGSSDPRALAEVDQVAAALAARLRTPVRIGYAATAEPSVRARVLSRRVGASGRVAVASWLLAPGLFQQRVYSSGADVVGQPLAAHPNVVDLVLRRYAGQAARLTS